jgi:hypothetical protein
MDGPTLLHEARAAGLMVTAEGGRLRVRGPRRAEALARQLLAYKEAVLLCLTEPRPALGIGPDDLDPDWRVEWEERAAIMEYDGKLPRERAEALALVDILGRMKRLGLFPRQ